jgi:hypothetical protein
MAKKGKRVITPEQRAIWIVRDVRHMFDAAAMTLEELCKKSGVSRGTTHKILVNEPVKRVMAVRVFRVLNDNELRTDKTHVVKKEQSK